MYHPVMVWTEADKVFRRVVGFVGIDVVNVNYFVKSADDARFYCFSICFKVYVVSFSLVVCFVFVKMEYVIIATGAEAFGVDGHFSFASLACLYFWLPF